MWLYFNPNQYWIVRISERKIKYKKCRDNKVWGSDYFYRKADMGQTP